MVSCWRRFPTTAACRKYCFGDTVCLGNKHAQKRNPIGYKREGKKKPWSLPCFFPLLHNHPAVFFSLLSWPHPTLEWIQRASALLSCLLPETKEVKLLEKNESSLAELEKQMCRDISAASKYNAAYEMCIRGNLINVLSCRGRNLNSG